MNRAEFFQGLDLELWDLNGRRLIQAAYELAKLGHAKQKRDDGDRYFNHPRDVARLMVKFSYASWKELCAALLHDGLEDTYIPDIVYIQTFGPDVYRWIEILSKSVPRIDPLTGCVTGYVKKTVEDYFEELMRSPKEVRAIKCCDRLHNLRTIGSRSAKKKREQIEETQKYILPLADATNRAIGEAIRFEITLIEAELLAKASQIV